MLSSLMLTFDRGGFLFKTPRGYYSKLIFKGHWPIKRILFILKLYNVCHMGNKMQSYCVDILHVSPSNLILQRINVRQYLLVRF